MDKAGVEMAIEIEKKYRVTAAQLAELENELADSGAEFTGEEFEENIIYGGEVLAAQNAVLRIRKVDSRTLLTFKRRIENQSDVKHQIEI